MTTSTAAGTRTGRPTRRRRGQRGAAAVEFGLLVPLLMMLLFGIVDYGLWFNESLNVRQGVREGARQGVVKNLPDCPPDLEDDPSGNFSGAAGDEMRKIACVAADRIGAVAGPSATYVRVSAPDGWARGKPLLVCGMVKARGLVGFVPLPSDGLVKSTVRMSIEVAYPAPATTSYQSPTLPAGGSWAWCT